MIIKKSKDPAVKGIGIYTDNNTFANPVNPEKIFIPDTLGELYGYFGLKN